MNKKAERDLRGYIKKTLWSASILIGALVIAMLCAHFLGAPTFFAPLVGAFIGVILATLNLFAIGYAFYVIAIKGGKKWPLILPISSFVAMCLVAFLMAKFWPAYIFGFALGLTSPVIFCAAIVFLG